MNIGVFCKKCREYPCMRNRYTSDKIEICYSYVEGRHGLFKWIDEYKESRDSALAEIFKV